MRAVVLGHHHQAGGVLVEPVHDAGAPLAADAGETVAAMRDQRIDQRAGPMSGGGMNHEIAGLVDDDDVAVFMDDVKRDRLGLRRGRFGGRDIHGQCSAGIDAVARIADRRPVDGDGAGFDQGLEAGSRQLGDMPRQHAIEPLAGFRLGDKDGRGWRHR